MTPQATVAERARELLSKATPGPWETDSVETEDGYGKYYTQEITGPDGNVVCEFSNADGEIHQDFDEDGGSRWDEKARNNAALIAAAPELAQGVIRLSEEIIDARINLAGGDIGSLPNDWTLAQVVDARMDDLRKYMNQVRDTCKRAEAAEQRLAEIHAEATNSDGTAWSTLLSRIATLATAPTKGAETEGAGG